MICINFSEEDSAYSAFHYFQPGKRARREAICFLLACSVPEVNIGITSRRNPHLRGILIEAAWVAVRKDPALILAYNQLLKKVSKKIAIVKIARKLLNRIRYVLKNKQEYVTAVVQ